MRDEKMKTGKILPLLIVMLNSIAGEAFPAIVPDTIAIRDTLQLQAPDSMKTWKYDGHINLSFNQMALSNWAEGGESTISGVTFAKFKANYRKDNFKADNFVHIIYGMNWTKENGFRKTDDKIDIGSTWGYSAFRKWYYSSNINLKSQFSEGYKYPDDSTLVSNFLAPANLLVSAGLEYKPYDNLSLFLSPASGKFIFVMDQELADKGAFGVQAAVKDTAGNIIEPGKNFRAEFGINVILNFSAEIIKNVDLDTKLNLYNNYLDYEHSNRWNIDVDWESAFNFKINSHLSSNLYLHLLYDHNIDIPTYEVIDGQKVEVGKGPKLQVKENFGIGISIKV